VLGLAEVRHMGDPALAEAATAALSKITATLPERVQRQAVHAISQTYRYQSRPQAPPHMAVIREASWDEVALDMQYRDKDGSITARRIWPLSVVFLDRTLMLLAWCTLRQDFRRFHIGSMQDVRRTDDSFRPRRVPLLRAFTQTMREQRPMPAPPPPTG
jgi:predicted DNA-binding transcriptional regulator YafY